MCDSRGEAQVVSFLTPSILAYLEHMASLPSPPQNTAVTKLLDRRWRIFEITKGDVRVTFFYGDGLTAILVRGFPKKGQKTPKGEITHAQNAAKAYKEESAAGRLRIIS